MSRKLEIRSIPSTPEATEGFQTRKISAALGNGQKLLVFVVTDDCVEGDDVTKLSAILKAKYEDDKTRVMTLAMSSDTKFEIYEEGAALAEGPTFMETERDLLLDYANAYRDYTKDFVADLQEPLFKARKKVTYILDVLDRDEIAGDWAAVTESLAYDGTDGP